MGDTYLLNQSIEIGSQRPLQSSRRTSAGPLLEQSRDSTRRLIQMGIRRPPKKGCGGGSQPSPPPPVPPVKPSA
jgi:hypothetical protein